MVEKSPAKVAEWCGTLGSILVQKSSRDALQHYVLEQRVNGHRFSIMLNQNILVDLGLPHVNGAASHKIRKCWHQDHPATVHIKGDLPPARRATLEGADMGNGGPLKSEEPQRKPSPPPRYDEILACKRSSFGLQSQVELLRAVLDCLCEKAGLDRQDVYLWVHGVVPNEVWQPMWDGLTVDLLRAQRERVSPRTAPSPRPTPRISPRNGSKAQMMRSPHSPYTNSDGASHPYGPGPQQAWEAPGSHRDFEAESTAAASSRRRSFTYSFSQGNKHGKEEPNLFAEPTDPDMGYESDRASVNVRRNSTAPPQSGGRRGEDDVGYNNYDHLDVSARSAHATADPDGVSSGGREARRQRQLEDLELMRRNWEDAQSSSRWGRKGEDDGGSEVPDALNLSVRSAPSTADVESTFLAQETRRRRHAEEAQDAVRRQMEELHHWQAEASTRDLDSDAMCNGARTQSSPRSMGGPNPYAASDAGDRSSVRSMPADRSETESQMAASEAMAAWLDVESEAPCMLPLDLAEWLRTLPKERISDEARKFVASRVLKDKIDGDRFGELLADGRFEELDIEDDRVAATLSKFFKNKQREETMAEAARTTGAINRALMHKKGEVVMA
mmetsp:Transcript_43044/g.98991  ORF Transcript_43044/g.98991 Transcript_43044/m.98991 type:complete len:614 (+) Transcript_43044:62-1903(+)